MIFEVFAVFFRLGLASFGGPVAHIGYFHDEIVRRRRWVPESEFADLVALCQFLPGPASSQLAYALGRRRAALAGALAASLGFLLPSAVLMIAFAYGVAHVGTLAHVGWLQGLKVAAVAVVAQAVLVMHRSLCPDRVRTALALAAAVVALVVASTWGQVAALAAGAVAGVFFLSSEAVPDALSAAGGRRSSRAVGIAVLGVWAGLLLLLPVAAHAMGSPSLAVFDRFYRAGSLVFGGGHVVLPLLHASVVAPGWVSDGAFLAGYGAAQGIPGPLFSFAGYLGASMTIGPGGVAGGLWALLAIYLPAWLVIAGALPLWDRLRELPRLRAAMSGTNAAVVGVLVAALYTPIWTDGIQTPRHFALGLVAFAALTLWRAPAWAIVLACAAIGAAWL